MNEEEQKKWLIENVDYILQIRLEELKDDKETVLSFSSRYREVTNSFENKIFGSAAGIATLLTALLTAIIAFRGFDQYAWTVLILLIIDLGIVGAAEYWFSSHQKRSGRLWFELDQKYASAITCVNRQRIFVASTTSRNDSIKLDQLPLLVPYTAVTLSQYRNAIIHQIEEVRKFIRLSYINQTLVHLSDRQKKFVSDAYDSYESKKKEFEREAEFLSGLPLNVKPTQSWNITSGLVCE